MDFVATLAIPATQTLWRAHEVPALTAAALHPVPETPEQPVRELLRLERVDGKQVTKPLSEADREALEEVWASKGLALPTGDLTAQQWVPYLVAFNENPGDPTWQFAVMPPRDPYLAQRIAQVAAEEGHRKALRRAIERRDIEARSPLTMDPAEPWQALENMVLTRGALIKFCESLCIRVEVQRDVPSPVFELPEDRPVTVGRLVEAIAETLHPTDVWNGTTTQGQAENMLRELMEAGELSAKHPTTLERLTYWAGDEFLRAVVLPQELRPILGRFGIELLLTAAGSGPHLWTIERAAQAIATQEGWHTGARDSLKARMMKAAQEGALLVRDPHTELDYRPNEVRDFYDLVTPEDVNDWLSRSRVSYRWQVATGDHPADSVDEHWPNHVGGKRLWSLADAFAELERQQGWPPGLWESKAREAAAQGSGLVIRSPQGDARKTNRLSVLLRDRLFADDLNEWLQRRGAPYRLLEALPSTPQVAGPNLHPTSRVHRLKARRHVLDPAIDLAIEAAGGLSDHVAVWNAFVALAELKTPPKPLISARDGEVNYQTASGASGIDKAAFVRRIKRRAEKTGAGR